MDVHRKNSSESSDDALDECAKNAARLSAVVTHSAEVCQTSDYRQTMTKKSKSEEASASKLSPMCDDGDLLIRCEERRDQFYDTENTASGRSDHKKRMRTKLQRQTSLDSTEASIGLSYGGGGTSKLQRHRSSDSNDERRRQNRYHYGIYHQPSITNDIYLEQNFTTKSELAIEHFPNDGSSKMYALQKKTPMRKDSNSTMSAIQLPTVGAASTSNPRLRRNSNTTNKQLPSGIVSVRRIKSTALETCCAQPSVSNLSAHPNSAEAISGRPLKNPQHAVLPPPSKCLVRNQHLNLFPKGGNHSTISGASATSVNSISDSVYPIAEQADERSINESFVLHTESESDDEDSESEEDDEDDDDRGGEREIRRAAREPNADNDEDNDLGEGGAQCRKSTTSESDNERRLTQSTDSDTENNGSRSPLLDTKHRSPGSDAECDKGKKSSGQAGPAKPKAAFPVSPMVELDEVSLGEAQALPVFATGTTKSEDSGCPSSDCEQASASSKDMLLSKDRKHTSEAERKWHDFSMDANVISVGVAQTGDGDGGAKEKLTAEELRAAHEAKGAIPKTRQAGGGGEEPSTSRGSRAVASTSKNALESENQKPKSIRRSFSSQSIQSDCDPMAVEMFRHLYEGIHDPEGQLSSYDSYLTAQRDEQTSAGASRTQQIFPVQRKPYLYLHTSYRPFRKTRLTRTRRHDSSVDTTASSRDADHSSMTPATSDNRNWDFLDIEMQESIDTFIIQELIEDHRQAFKKPSVPNEIAAQPATSQCPTINRIGPNDSVYWGHYNLPPEKQTQPKRYFKFPIKCFGNRELKVSMDRLQLLALFDQDFGCFQTILAILLAALVSVLGSVILHLGFYKDLYAFIFCFVIAGSQFSLLKSVQPDASSPVHGFNKTVAYSRPIYFCLCASILILSYHFSSAAAGPPTSLFGIPFSARSFFHVLQELMATVLLLLPLLFSFGLFPQINTFLMYVLEQFDMHVFGGNAVCSLLSAFLGIFRSALACSMLYGFAFGGLSEPRSTQHVLFSFYCALNVAVGYHLSRSASDFTFLWSIIKSSFALHPDEDEELRRATKLSRKELNMPRDANGNKATPTASTAEVKTNSESLGSTEFPNTDDDDKFPSPKETLEDPLPAKLKGTVNSRLKNDFLVGIVIVIVVFSLHSSTVFAVLQPELNPILQTAAVVLGFVLHYVIPQMRKYLPWLCFAKPILRQNEYGLYETSNAAVIMWFEKVYVFLGFFERNVLLPLVFISALTSESGKVVAKFGISMGVAIVVVCGMKGQRASSANSSTRGHCSLLPQVFAAPTRTRPASTSSSCSRRCSFATTTTRGAKRFSSITFSFRSFSRKPPSCF